MPKFAYKIRDEHDNIFSGTLEGSSEEEILDRLAEKKQIPISIEELNFDGTKKDRSLFDRINESLLHMQNQVPYKNVVFFTRQLATMLNAGVPLSHALSQLAETEKPVFKRIIHNIVNDIGMGSNLSDAVAKHPGAFNTMYRFVVHSGEIVGALDRVLDQLASYMENVAALRQKVVGALRYPLFIAGFVVLLVFAILWKLVPAFENLYNSFQVELPMPTQILLNISHGIQANFILIVASVIGLIVVFMFLWSNLSFKTFFHRLVLAIPVFGKILTKNTLATFCRSMALLLGSGTPILQAIEVTGMIMGNLTYSQRLEDVYNKLRTGDLLSGSLKEAGGFPVLITQLVKTGEEAGKIDELLEKAAEFYEREIRVTVDSLASIIEPALIILLATVVGLILIALYFPVFNLGQLINR